MRDMPFIFVLHSIAPSLADAATGKTVDYAGKNVGQAGKPDLRSLMSRYCTIPVRLNVIHLLRPVRC
jgi:hypothetical protein